ncbi:MAG: MBL fold metallo-hydrolase [Actinomycetota bacterium]
MELELFVTQGLGDNSYLIVSDGEAAIVDPQRDVGRVLAAAEARRAGIRLVLETHVHNDYVSGALELRVATGAEIAGSAAAGYGFAYSALREGDELELGGVRLRAMETPGHTPEHLSFLVSEGRTPMGVFTGGSLMVGSAGRTDLLGPEMTDRLTRAQYASLRRLAALPDDAQVLPTHGAGSFCASGTPQESRTSTIAHERAENPALASLDLESFVEQQLAGLAAFPAYYAHMAPINRAGPKVYGSVPKPPGLSAESFAARVGTAHVIDARDSREFAASHVPGSLNVQLQDSFSSYVGWLVPFNTPILLVLPEPESDAAEEAASALFRIGFERVVGYLDGGIDAWRSAGHEVRSYPVASVDDLLEALRDGSISVLDVRQRTEWDAGHLEDSRHIFVGDLPGRLGELPPDRETWTVCASGNRSGIAASILDRAGMPARLVAPGGVSQALRRRA